MAKMCRVPCMAGKAQKWDCPEKGLALYRCLSNDCLRSDCHGTGVMRPFYRSTQYGMKNSVGYLIRRSSNLLMPQMEALFASESLTFSQWTVLMALREWGQSTAADLARHICHDTGSLTRILDELEERGLITRARSETDRRVVGLTLTPKGLSMVETHLPRVVDFWNGLISDFSHVVVKLLVKLFG